LTSRLLPLVLVLACAAPAAAQPDELSPELRTFLRSWAEHMRGIETLRVRFTQIKEMRILRNPLRSEGYTLLKGREVLMVVHDRQGRRETELRVSEGEVRIHFPRLNRVEVIRMDPTAAGPAPTPFPLIGEDIEALPERYQLELGADPDGRPRLTLAPLEGDEQTGGTVLVFDEEFHVVEARQVNERGDRITLEVQAFEINPSDPPVTDADLEMTVRPDAEVVEVGPGGGR
jgi:hypothetical protein